MENENNNNNNYLVIDDTKYETSLTKKFQTRKIYTPPNPKLVKAFIPGAIKAIYVKAGDTVRQGDKLLLLEAMKMRNDLCSQVNGTIKEVYVTVDQKVMKNQLLIEYL